LYVLLHKSSTKSFVSIESLVKVMGFEYYSVAEAQSSKSKKSAPNHF
jgi:hypothetical protein